MGLTERLLGAEGHWLFGRFIPNKLLSGLRRHLSVVAPGREADILTAIRARADELVEEDADLAVDAPGKGGVAMSAVVLAAFETLRPEFDGDERRTILFLQHVFDEVLERSMDVAIEVLTRGRRPLEAVDRALRTSGEMYGSYFDLAFERPDDSTFEMRVNRCLFRDFFARHDATIVTTVMCSWDANWMKALDPSVTGLRAERTSLLSLGDDACRFRVAATDDPLAQYQDALADRFNTSADPS